MILKEDGFEEIPYREAKIGNVVVYYGDDGKPEHSGVLVGRQKDYDVALVWSKWGKGHEVVHPLGACLWGGMQTLFYRIREWKSHNDFMHNS